LLDPPSARQSWAIARNKPRAELLSLQQSTINNQQSTINNQQSTINNPSLAERAVLTKRSGTRASLDQILLVVYFFVRQMNG
jgi:hypothetical protein